MSWHETSPVRLYKPPGTLTWTTSTMAPDTKRPCRYCNVVFPKSLMTRMIQTKTCFIVLLCPKAPRKDINPLWSAENIHTENEQSAKNSTLRHLQVSLCLQRHWRAPERLFQAAQVVTFVKIKWCNNGKWYNSGSIDRMEKQRVAFESEESGDSHSIYKCPILFSIGSFQNSIDRSNVFMHHVT